MAASVLSDVQYNSGIGGSRFAPDGQEAWIEEPCWDCDGRQMVAVARSSDILWLRCVSCHAGAVVQSGRTSPGRAPLSTPKGVPEPEEAVWLDVRECLGVNAWGAAVMLCRKLLLHLAVANGLPAKDKSGRAPNFEKSVRHLESEGYITAKMRPWVDRIRDVGNEANHEIPATTEQQAMDVARFTEQLLRLVYEMDAVMNESTPGAADPIA